MQGKRRRWPCTGNVFLSVLFRVLRTAGKRDIYTYYNEDDDQRLQFPMGITNRERERCIYSSSRNGGNAVEEARRAVCASALYYDDRFDEHTALVVPAAIHSQHPAAHHGKDGRRRWVLELSLSLFLGWRVRATFD